MKIDTVLERLKAYQPPEGWEGGSIFLLPENAMRDIYQFIIDNQLTRCIELGTGFGATTCAMTAAVEELGTGKVTSVDMYEHQPVNVHVLTKHIELSEQQLEFISDELGYNWYLPELIKQQTQHDVCEPLFDFCLLDGAHEWEPDALAFMLVARLIKPGGWIAVDDINYFFRLIPGWENFHQDKTDRELDTLQMEMVYELMVKTHPDFCDFRLTHNGRIGWARKKLPQDYQKPKGLLSRWFMR